MKKTLIVLSFFLACYNLIGQEINEKPSYGVKRWTSSIDNAIRSVFTHEETINNLPIIEITNNGTDWKIGNRLFKFPYQYYDKKNRVYLYSDIETDALTVPLTISGQIMEENGTTIILILNPEKNDKYGKVYAEIYVFEQNIEALFGK